MPLELPKRAESGAER